MKILVTGGAGFIGSNFIRYMLAKHPEMEIYNLDKLTYAGNLENLKDVDQRPNYYFVKADIADPHIDSIFKVGIDAVVNFAAESHVDRSIRDPGVFLQTNVQGTRVLLDAALKHMGGDNAGKVFFLHVSTDEVYGSLGSDDPPFRETNLLLPSSPYSASKAAADLLALAYYKTYGLAVAITRCSNNYGPYQFPEKLIPLMVTNALENKPLPVYGDGKNVRDWLHVNDHCRALELVLFEGQPGEIYNIGGHGERTNLEVVNLVLEQLNKPKELIQYVTDRLGHDRRYAIDPGKITQELGWSPAYAFEEGLGETIRWYMGNRSWWERIKSGEYRQYYMEMYGD
ncbi:MAG TPA: dTDP-glucose 4,6-dehydratase [Spirochaetia bacterium]|nr:dTDP-glucose 4,6-dehydratase [Spirochaetia bacterium]